MRAAVTFVCAGLIVGFGVTPAVAEPVSLAAACEATRDALATGGGTVTGTSGDAVFAGQRFSSADRIFDPTGTYGAIAAERIRAKDRRAALRYLKAPSATHWFNAGQFPDASGWASTYARARQDVLRLPEDCEAAAGGFQGPDGAGYAYESADVTFDEWGRIASWSQGGAVSNYTYAPQTIDLPAVTVAYSRWLRASQAASLNDTLRTIARLVAGLAVPTPEGIDATMRSYADPDRLIPLRVRTLRAGSLMYARNPYTKTYHAWRVYVKNGEAVAKRVAP